MTESSGLAASTLSSPRERIWQDPVIAHIHVPKCAGTSFRNMLIGHFGPAHLALYADDTFFVYSEQELTRYLADRSIRAFSSHFVRTFPPSIAGRDLVYVTFLRKPVDQFISYLTYVRKVFPAIQDPNLLSCLPPDLPSLSLREAAHWILTREHDVNFRENYTTNFFARFPFRNEYGDSMPEGFYREKRLSIAQRVLEQFFFVGITEQMDRSISLMQFLAQEQGLAFPHGKVSIENTSFDGRGDLSWIREDDEVGALLLASVEEDNQLYASAVARLDSYR